MRNLFRWLRFSPTTPQRTPGRQPRRSAPAPATSTRNVSDPELAKGVLPRGRPRNWKPGEPLPSKPVIYRHENPKTGKPHRFGLSFNGAQRIPDHQGDRELRRMPVRYQVARDDVTPAQLQAAEKLTIRKHRTAGAGNKTPVGTGTSRSGFATALRVPKATALMNRAASGRGPRAGGNPRVTVATKGATDVLVAALRSYYSVRGQPL